MLSDPQKSREAIEFYSRLKQKNMSQSVKVDRILQERGGTLFEALQEWVLNTPEGQAAFDEFVQKELDAVQRQEQVERETIEHEAEKAAQQLAQQLAEVEQIESQKKQNQPEESDLDRRIREGRERAGQKKSELLQESMSEPESIEEIVPRDINEVEAQIAQKSFDIDSIPPLNISLRDIGAFFSGEKVSSTVKKHMRAFLVALMRTAKLGYQPVLTIGIDVAKEIKLYSLANAVVARPIKVLTAQVGQQTQSMYVVAIKDTVVPFVQAQFPALIASTAMNQPLGEPIWQLSVIVSPSKGMPAVQQGSFFLPSSDAMPSVLIQVTKQKSLEPFFRAIEAEKSSVLAEPLISGKSKEPKKETLSSERIKQAKLALQQEAELLQKELIENADRLEELSGQAIREPEVEPAEPTDFTTERNQFEQQEKQVRQAVVAAKEASQMELQDTLSQLRYALAELDSLKKIHQQLQTKSSADAATVSQLKEEMQQQQDEFKKEKERSRDKEKQMAEDHDAQVKALKKQLEVAGIQVAAEVDERATKLITDLRRQKDAAFLEYQQEKERLSDEIAKLKQLLQEAKKSEHIEQLQSKDEKAALELVKKDFELQVQQVKQMYDEKIKNLQDENAAVVKKLKEQNEQLQGYIEQQKTETDATAEQLRLQVLKTEEAAQKSVDQQLRLRAEAQKSFELDRQKLNDATEKMKLDFGRQLDERDSLLRLQKEGGALLLAQAADAYHVEIEKMKLFIEEIQANLLVEQKKLNGLIDELQKDKAAAQAQLREFQEKSVADRSKIEAQLREARQASKDLQVRLNEIEAHSEPEIKKEIDLLSAALFEVNTTVDRIETDIKTLEKKNADTDKRGLEFVEKIDVAQTQFREIKEQLDTAGIDITTLAKKKMHEFDLFAHDSTSSEEALIQKLPEKKRADRFPVLQPSSVTGLFTDDFKKIEKAVMPEKMRTQASVFPLDNYSVSKKASSKTKYVAEVQAPLSPKKPGNAPKNDLNTDSNEYRYFRFPFSDEKKNIVEPKPQAPPKAPKAPSIKKRDMYEKLPPGRVEGQVLNHSSKDFLEQQLPLINPLSKQEESPGSSFVVQPAAMPLYVKRLRELSSDKDQEELGTIETRDDKKNRLDDQYDSAIQLEQKAPMQNAFPNQFFSSSGGIGGGSGTGFSLEKTVRAVWPAFAIGLLVLFLGLKLIGFF